jgi:hypothetical protein
MYMCYVCVCVCVCVWLHRKLPCRLTVIPDDPQSIKRFIELCFVKGEWKDGTLIYSMFCSFIFGDLLSLCSYQSVHESVRGNSLSICLPVYPLMSSTYACTLINVLISK